MDRQTDGQTENTIHRAAWSQLKSYLQPPTHGFYNTLQLTHGNNETKYIWGVTLILPLIDMTPLPLWREEISLLPESILLHQRPSGLINSINGTPATWDIARRQVNLPDEMVMIQVFCNLLQYKG